MLYIQERFCKIVDFLNVYKNLIDCHLVDFLTEDLWEKCLPNNLKLYMDSESVTKEFNTFQEEDSCPNSEVNKFLRCVSSLKLDNCESVLKREDFLSVHEDEKCEKQEFMKVKKWHEVESFTRAIVKLNKNKSSIIIDAGAGKGYASLHLSKRYDLPVLAIECSEINHKGAILQSELVNKRNEQPDCSIHFTLARIDEETDFVQMVKDKFPNLYQDKNLIMTALHACGSLTDSVIKAFLNVSDIKSLCIVPCCYHLASNSLASDYEFSKNARMLAQQSMERIREKNEPFSPSLFYRAVLQVILNRLGSADAKVGRKAPTNDFLTYAKWALKKVNIKEIPSDKILLETYSHYEKCKWKFIVFQRLRIEIAPLIEAAIILDKVLFIDQRKICKDVKLVQLFDPVLSPRSWAIVASK